MTVHHPIGSGATYEGSGVSIAAGEAAVEMIKPYTEKTNRPEVMGGIGGFASLFRLPSHRYREPVLASSSDGVGTKSAIAQAMDVHDTIGIDLVAMVVDDLVACGAEPLFLQDYIACGKLVPDKIATIVGGIAEGCVRAGCALVGGETAEHPGLMDPDDYDLAATARRHRRGRRHPRPGPGDARRRGPRAWRPPGCTPTGTRWSATSCWTSAGCRWTGTSRSSAAPWARSCSSRAGSTRSTAWRSAARPTCTPTRTSPAAGWSATWPGSSQPG